MIAEKHGQAVGFVYCSVGEYHIGSDVLLTTIHNMNVFRTVRSSLSGGKIALGLFRGVETWSQARKAKEILFRVTSDVNLAQAHRLAKRIGYKFVGGSYVKSGVEIPRGCRASGYGYIGHGSSCGSRWVYLCVFYALL